MCPQFNKKLKHHKLAGLYIGQKRKMVCVPNFAQFMDEVQIRYFSGQSTNSLVLVPNFLHCKMTASKSKNRKNLLFSLDGFHAKKCLMVFKRIKRANLSHTRELIWEKFQLTI